MKYIEKLLYYCINLFLKYKVATKIRLIYNFLYNSYYHALIF